MDSYIKLIPLTNGPWKKGVLKWVCSAMTFPPSGNSDHVIVSVSFDFPWYSQPDTPFHCIAYDYSCANCDGLVIIWEMFHGRISLNSVLLLSLVNFVSKFRFELIIYPSSKVSGQASLISMAFSCLWCCQSS